MRTLIFLLLFATSVTCIFSDDPVPKQTFGANFAQCRGSIATSNISLPYWFVGSQQNGTVPLLVHAGDSVSCSSFRALFADFGPYRIGPAGSTVLENVYSWNKVANLLFLDLAAANGSQYDLKTLSTSLANGVFNFIQKNKLSDQPVYLSGGGKSTPIILQTALDLQAVLKSSFAGVILTGFLPSLASKVNSAVVLSYYTGNIEKSELYALQPCCPSPSGAPLEKCNFAQYVSFDKYGRPVALNFTDNEKQECADGIALIANGFLNKGNNYFNLYNDCYNQPGPRKEGKSKSSTSSYTARYSVFTNGSRNFFDQGANINTDSTDAELGYNCEFVDVVENYLKSFLGISAPICDNTRVDEILLQDVTDLLSAVLALPNIGILVLNGDFETESSSLAAEQFLEQFANAKQSTFTDRTQFEYISASLFPILAGFRRKITIGNSRLDFVSIKGAGRMVALDKPGASLDVVAQFLYSTPPNFDTKHKAFDLPSKNGRRIWTRKQADRVWTLPGITFPINFRQYSGFLHSVAHGSFSSIHYWLVESQGNAATDPLVLWLNGGPGCSSIGGLLGENGPFRVNPDGKTLFENVYSWNKVANVLYLDAPSGAGFSFGDSTNSTYTDEMTVNEIYVALLDFFTVFPELRERPFFVFGESYAAVFASMLAKRIQQDQEGVSPIHLQGLGIANGQLSWTDQLNSAIHYLYFHGVVGKREWDSLQQCCKASNDPTWFEYCNFSVYVNWNNGQLSPKDNSFCSRKIIEFTKLRVEHTVTNIFNMYEDCYTQSSTLYGSQLLKGNSAQAKKHIKNRYTNLELLSPMDVTDSLGGFPCYERNETRTWLNHPEVQQSLHVDAARILWTECNDAIYSNYNQQHPSLDAVMDSLVRSGQELRMLFFNGDVDAAALFMGDEWFVEALADRNALDTISAHAPWIYRTQNAGYHKRFGNANRTLTVEFTTVKGAGHLIPLDRAGPALQLFANFIADKDLNTPFLVSDANSDLLDEYQVKVEAAKVSSGESARRVKRSSPPKQPWEKPAPPPPAPGSRSADKVKSVPFATFEPNFDVYAGYLNASAGNYIYYVLTESQNNPSTDPLLLWMNGGPGCSGLIGLFTENGPFRPNFDLVSLYENVFSWNKFANMLFIESPRDVGFSYRAKDVLDDQLWNDNKTADDLILALAQFYERFPEYKQRQFFMTGESYSGVYVPTAVDALMRKIVDGEMNYVNLQGFAIGNGILNEHKQINSAVSLGYYRGFRGKAEYDRLKKCCTNTSVPMTYCDFQSYVEIDPAGYPHSRKNDGSVQAQCGEWVVQQGYNDVWYGGNSYYNTYMDQYYPQSNPSPPGSRRKREAQPLSDRRLFVDQRAKIDKDNTDVNWGFYFWGNPEPYLNQQRVKEAFHAVPNNREWKQCYRYLDRTYVQTHFDTKPVYDSIFKQATSIGLPLRVLHFEGDVDMGCQFLMAEWFDEDLAESLKMDGSERKQWSFRQPGADDAILTTGGYHKQFSGFSGNITIDYATIKGAGHFVSMDRPAPTLQLLYNFVMNTGNFNAAFPHSVSPQPIKQEYQNPKPDVPIPAQDTVYSLPGLTWSPNFTHYAGYLNADKGDYMFYWFLESQNLPYSDPIILRINGNPGCSSLSGLFTDVGPFYPNPDGSTIFENRYSWNKAANLLFIDAPKGSGFSYQNQTVDSETLFSDDLTAAALASALSSFRSSYRAFADRPIYVAAEGYAAVPASALVRLLQKQIQENTTDLSLAGLIIGNGQLSLLSQTQTLPDFLQYRGFGTVKDYTSLKQCCNSMNKTTACDYSFFFEYSTGFPVMKNFTDQNIQECAEILQKYNLFASSNANPYLDCYVEDYRRARTPDEIVLGTPENFIPLSTDANGGFRCYVDSALGRYLKREYVRDALHVPSFVQDWQSCNADIDKRYRREYPTARKLFDDIIGSPVGVNILLYNGDSDLQNGFLQTQTFIRELATAHNLESAPRRAWTYRASAGVQRITAGYTHSFAIANTIIDVATVKGAGGMAARDRPGPVLQMITNFVNGRHFSQQHPWNTNRLQMLKQYTEVGADIQSPITTTNVPKTAAPTSNPDPGSARGADASFAFILALMFMF